MTTPKFLNSRFLFHKGRINSNQFYCDMSRSYSNKEIDSNVHNLNKNEIKTGNKLNSEKSLGDENSSIKITKIYGNMTGMDKIDGMAGQTAGLDKDDVKGDRRPEEGIYIYSGGLNFDTNKKSDKKP